MPHIDDGILHAYLDGAIDALAAAGELPDAMSKADVVAHLTTCADCRARLDDERDVRERAGRVLSDVSLPQVAVPPFSAIEATPRARRPARRALPLTWAATVLLAVGAGWWGSAQWRASEPGMIASSRQESANQTMSQENAEALASDGVQAAPAAPPVPAASAPAVQDDASAIANAAAPPPSAAVGEAAAASVRQADAVTSTDARDAPVSSLESRTALQNARRSEQRLDPVTRAAEPAGAATSTAVPLIPQQLAAGTVRLADSAAAVYLVPNAEMVAFERLLTRERAGTMHWDAVGATQRAGIADQLFIVDGASEPVIERAHDVGATSVRITQTLASGQPIEVLTWRQEAVALSEIVVVPSAADTRERAARFRSAPAAAQAPPPAAPPADAARAASEAGKAADASAGVSMMSTGRARVLPDGRRELVLRSASSPVWVALRARLPEEDMTELASRLVLLDARR